MSKRYFIDTDNSSHRYLVELDYKQEWDEWNELPEDDERGWETPTYALRLDGSDVTFTNPHIDGKPLDP
jgi:hypothetical protein